MIYKAFDHLRGENQYWNVYKWKSSWFQLQTLFRLNISLLSARSIKPDFLVIWDLITANNHRLILHGYFRSKQNLISINSVTKVNGSEESHTKVYRVIINAEDSFLACYVCGRDCKREPNLGSQMHSQVCFFRDWNNVFLWLSLNIYTWCIQ